MPSPFPGMDPYLEAADLWPDVHARLIGEIAAALTPRLRPRYFAKVESRTYVPDVDDPALHLIVPDVQVLERLRRGRAAWDPWKPVASGGVAVAEGVDVTDLIIDELRETLIEVHEVASRELVTVIEVVSPTNKVRGSEAFGSFERKRRDCIAAGVNWLEIDLLRGGERPSAPRVFESVAYRIFRDRDVDGSRRQCHAWPVALRDPLPVVGVPLKQADGEVTLDLQATLHATYVRAGYDMMVDYAADPPSPALSADDAAWVDGLLRERELRGT